MDLVFLCAIWISTFRYKWNVKVKSTIFVGNGCTKKEKQDYRQRGKYQVFVSWKGTNGNGFEMEVNTKLPFLLKGELKIYIVNPL